MNELNQWRNISERNNQLFSRLTDPKYLRVKINQLESINMNTQWKSMQSKLKKEQRVLHFSELDRICRIKALIIVGFEIVLSLFLLAIGMLFFFHDSWF